MVRVSRVFCAVSASPAAISSRIRGSKRAVSPITLKRMPFSSSLATSCSSARRKSCIRIDTSSAGRRQFSLEKAKSVRNSTPRSMHARTVVRTASTPLRWPATRGSMRCFAQRPLPSMMIAMCRGTLRGTGISRVELSNTGNGRGGRRDSLRGDCDGRGDAARSLDRQQIRFLALEHLVDLGDVSVGELLHIDLRMSLIVLRDFVILEQFLQVFVRVAPDIANRDTRVLSLVANHLDQFLAPIFRERRHRHPDQVAGGCGIETEIRIPDRLFDNLDHLLLPRLHRDRPRVGQRNVGDLIDRHHRAVIIYLDMVEQTRMGSAGTHLLIVVLESVDGLLHFVLGGLLKLCDHRLLLSLSNSERACP